jgi:four helix bundle protein
MFAKSFEDLEIWKMAREIVKDVYLDFSACRDFEFRNQINSAAISIMNNIAEGHGREGKKEFHQFLNISKSSCNEVKNMYYIAEDLNYLDKEISEKRRSRCDHEKNAIAKLMYHLKSK